MSRFVFCSALAAWALVMPLAGCAGGAAAGNGNPGPGDARRAYYNTRQYQQEQPFAYSEPWVDDFYDSSYEESLYSPFSFN
ncbi:MAG: hypothetical protein N2322_00760 [Terrimicrobiaceae bacterium]|nr:hypothetical protein [Terrimicrobiaceae bacterium]